MARILIIDDDDQIREMLKLFLEYAGYDVLSAADGKSGMALFDATPFPWRKEHDMGRWFSRSDVGEMAG